MTNNKPGAHKSRLFAGSMMSSILFAGNAMAAASSQNDNALLADRKIAYALTTSHWSVYQTENGSAECANGYNEGPREQFKALYPNGGTVEETQLAFEGDVRYPLTREDNFPYREVTGSIGIGLDLDSKVEARDFTSPDGQKGIDNELYRAIGCTRLFRLPDGTFAHFANQWINEYGYNRIVIELTDVDSLADDDAVNVTIYRGRDRLITDASGNNFLPGGSNRLDERFSAKFIQTLKGKIVAGRLTTEPADVSWPWSAFYTRPYAYDLKRMQLSLTVDPERAEGIIGSFADVDSWYRSVSRSWSTHHSSYGGLSQASLYRTLRRLADGIPDSNGVNTAISSAMSVKFVQVFLTRGEPSTPTREDRVASNRQTLAND